MLLSHFQGGGCGRHHFHHAFSEGERKNLLENRGQMEEFLKYMSVLLESKLYTDEVKERLEQQLQVVHDAEKGWSFVGDSLK